MAASYCLAILAGFCFHGPNINAQISDIGLGYAVMVKSPDYQADTRQTDVVVFHDWRNEAKACADANCIRYRRTCSNDKGKSYVCHFEIAITGRLGDGRIDIAAASADGISKAESEISLWFSSDASMLPLSALKDAAQSGSLPRCPADLDPKLCNPS